MPVFLLMTLFFAYLSFLAWFRYSTLVSYMMKRQALLRKLGILTLGPRSREELEGPLYKWISRIFFLVGLLIAAFPTVVGVLDMLGILAT